MKKYLLKLSLFLTGVILGFQELPAQDGKNTEAQIDQLFAKWDKPDSPGASVVVVKDNETVYTGAFGSAQLEYDIPIRPNTVFHVASISKQFTVFSILLLAEEGKLSLDDEVRKYFPELPEYGKKITLRHLANHSSGLRDQWDLLMLAGWRLDDVITREHILKVVSRQKELNFNPGDRNLYSNTGFTLLAEVVARVSGKSFAQFTEERIFKPLGMKNTLFYDDHEKIVKNRAYSYHEKGDYFKKSVLSYANVGATSLFTTAEDFAQWALNFENPRVGNEAIITQMNERTRLNSGGETGFALGQFVGTYRGVKVIAHSGSDAGYKAYFIRFPDHHLSVAVFGNVSSFNATGKALEIADVYLKDVYPKEENARRKAFKHKRRIFTKLNRQQLEKFTGNYWNPEDWYRREILFKNDSLIYSRPGENDTPLAPISENEFKMIGDSENVSVVFNENDNGEARMQVLVNDREPINFYAYAPVNPKEYTGTFYSEELETSYSLVVENGKLIIKHIRLSDIELKPIKKDLFISDHNKYRQIEFVRDKANRVTGFKVYNFRVRGLWFKKM
ncbi:serine hydrolase [Leptobacterium flavescens]|uniref:Serine hydrolase n=1 Tax=Leptobacterium flavescens TaxID=472055 RepID=A0A6P0UMA8_9FLAO|nr:serine hydrolase domain-containing protein [Leptobacterium flavescens]NER14364.1 serine hydrolase [Leptobacterium flavescens]